MASSSTTPHPTIAQGEKPEKFSDGDFKRWQQNMLFYLTTLSLSRFLKEDPPTVAENEIHAEGISLSESFQVAAMIEKFPPLWKDFKNYLKNKRKDMRLENLIVRLRIEDDSKSTKAKASGMAAKVNIVESSQHQRLADDSVSILYPQEPSF